MSTPPRFRVELDPTSGRWAVMDHAVAGLPYPFPLRWDTEEQAESFMDRVVAIMDGESEMVMSDLRGDSDRLRGGRRR